METALVDAVDSLFGDATHDDKLIDSLPTTAEDVGEITALQSTVANVPTTVEFSDWIIPVTVQ